MCLHVGLDLYVQTHFYTNTLDVHMPNHMRLRLNLAHVQRRLRFLPDSHPGSREVSGGRKEGMNVVGSAALWWRKGTEGEEER